MAGTPITALILDVDGVLLASPHEQAWRQARVGIADPARFTTRLYQEQVAGKPRRDGALAALTALAVPGAADLAEDYARRKQSALEAIIRTGGVTAYPDALRFVVAASRAGLRLAAASSSRNADAMMAAIAMPDGRTLRQMFAVDVSGREVAEGKPAPDLVLLAASELGIAASSCLVIEDAPAGILAARAAGSRSLGVARLEDADLLWAAGADQVVATLDRILVCDLLDGQLDEVAG